MTLSLGLVTHRFACVSTDRRINANGKAEDDEFDKTCTLETIDAKVGVSFAGLAKAPRYHAHVNLLESIEACAAPDFRLLEIMRRLTTRLNSSFLQNRDIRNIPRYLRKFSVLFLGFGYHGHTSHPIFGLISNFEDPDDNVMVHEPWPEFRPFLYELPKALNAHMMFIGNSNGLDVNLARNLQQVSHTLSPHAVNAKMVHLIQKASQNPLSGNTIGGQCTSIIMLAPRLERSETNYKVLSPQRTQYFPAAVRAFPGDTGHMHNLTFAHEDPDAPYLIVPEVNRNKPCPCGSGKRYKYCHRARKGMKKIEINYQAGSENPQGGRLLIPSSSLGA